MRVRAPNAVFSEVDTSCNAHFKEGLNEPLKQRVSFNFEFSFENSRDVRVRKKRTDAASSEVDTSCNAAF